MWPDLQKPNTIARLSYACLLTLKTALANISAPTNTRKQSAETFEMFVLWLRNQHYFTCDVIGIKMTHRDLPYYEAIRPKQVMNINFTKTSTKMMQTVYIPLSITWSQVIVSGSSKHWLIRHSMASTAIYSSRDCGELDMADRAWIPEVQRKPVAILCCFIPSKSLLIQWLFNLPLVAQWKLLFTVRC